MAAELTYEIKGLGLVDRELNALAGAVTDEGMSATLKTIGVIGERRAAASFRDERAPEMVADLGDAEAAAGRPWEPLAPNTQAARRGSGKQARTLRDTGHGAMSVTSQVGRGYVEIGSGVEHMAYQHGGTRPYTIVPKTKGALHFLTADGFVTVRIVHHPGIPARPFIGFDHSDVEHVLELIDGRLQRAGI